MMYNLILLIPIHCALSEQPNMKMRVSRHGLDYANNVTSRMLNNQLSLLRIPDIDHDLIKAWDIRITDLVAPSYSYSLQPNWWGPDGASIELQSKVRVCKRIITDICFNLDLVKINVRGVSIRMKSKPGRTEDGNVKIADTDVETKIDTLGVDVSGGVTGWVLNFLHDKLAHLVKSKAQNLISETAKQFLLRDGNEGFASFPVHVKAGQFDVDYGLTETPTITKDYIEGASRGKVTHPKLSSKTPNPWTPLPTRTSGTKMLTYWISDKIINDMSYLGHVANLTHRRIFSDDPRNGAYLRVHCDQGQICIGSAIPQVTEKYPDICGIVMRLVTSEPPVIGVHDNGTSMTLSGIVHLSMSNENISAEFSTKSHIKLRMKHTKLIGQAEVDRLEINNVESVLGSQYTEALKKGLPTVLKPILENEINECLATGLEIPIAQGAEFVDPQISLLERTVRIETNLHYTRSSLHDEL